MPGSPLRRRSSSRQTWIHGSLALALALIGGIVVVGPVSQASAPAAMVPRSAADGGYGSFFNVSPGLGNVVTSLAVGDDTLYVGGFFNGGSDDSMITSLSRTGGAWTPLGQGIGGPNGSSFVKTLTFKDDTLYVGGVFPNTSGVSGTTNIAAWSDGAWTSMKSFDGTQTNGDISALATVDDTLYATGGFLSIGGVAAPHVAAWSDDTWHAMGSGPALYTQAITADSTAVYVGGNFAGGLSRYTSGVWGPLSPGLDSSTDVSALALHDDTLYVGGTLYPTGGTAAMRYVVARSISGNSWHALGPGLNRTVRSLAMDPVHGLLYAGGPFENPSDGDDTYIAQAWDEGISTWIPLDDTTGATPFDTVGRSTSAIAVDDSVAYLSGTFECAGLVCVTKWTWDAPTAALSTSSGYVGSTVPITGWGLIGVSGASAVRFGSTPAVYSRDDSTHMSVTVPNLAPGTYTVYVDAVGGTANAGSYTVVSPPIPPTPIPPSAPLDVTATAGDASARVSWQPPASQGSFPVTNYEVTSSTDGRTCLVSVTSCEVTGLANGTTYTFTVRALSGAGWSVDSAPSNAVTPSAEPPPPLTSITITGTRTGTKATVEGSTTGFGMGGMVMAHTRTARGTPYTPGSTTLVSMDGTFDWSRSVGKKKTLWVYFTGGGAKSNIVRLTP